MHRHGGNMAAKGHPDPKMTFLLKFSSILESIPRKNNINHMHDSGQTMMITCGFLLVV
jgi:hypothetical protein